MSVVTLVSGPDRSGPGGFTYARVAGTGDGTIAGFDPFRDTLALVVLLPGRARGEGLLRGGEVGADAEPQSTSSPPLGRSGLSGTASVPGGGGRCRRVEGRRLVPALRLDGEAFSAWTSREPLP